MPCDNPVVFQTDLFTSGEDGYVLYRIPGITATRKGTLIAYCEARDAASDWANIDLYMRRSLDGGESWEERRLLADGIRTGDTVNNPVMISSSDGSVHLLYCRNYASCFYSVSTDEGASWTPPRDITSVFERFRDEYPWQVIATGPCHGIQAEDGRLIVPVWLAQDKSHRPSAVSSIYSDDGGESWQRGEIISGSGELVNPNETAAVRLPDGRILFNMRNESPVKRRSMTFSADGARGWSSPYFDNSLPDPVCCGSMADCGQDGAGYVLFCNCASEDGRRNLTLRKSRDGVKWDGGTVVQPGGAGYSDLAVYGGGIYVLYERFFTGGPHLTLAKLDIDRVLK